MNEPFANKLINEREVKISKVQESLYLLYLEMVRKKYKAASSGEAAETFIACPLKVNKYKQS